MPVKEEDVFCKSVKWKVNTSKYEFKDRGSENKWREFIKTVRNNKPVKPSRRSSVVKDIMPASVYERLSQIVDLQPMTSEERQKKAVPNEIFTEDSFTSLYMKNVRRSVPLLSRPKLLTKISLSSTSSSSHQSESSMPDTVDQNRRSALERLVAEGGPVSLKLRSTPLRALVGAIDRPVYSDMHVHPASRDHPGVRKKQPILIDRGGVPQKKRSPYHNFLCKPKKKAAEAWRPPVMPVIPPGTHVCDYHTYMEGYDLTLLQKEAITTDAIVRDYCDWVQTLGGAVMPQLQESVVKELFNLSFDKPVAKALCTRIRELPVVPDTVAQASHAPHKAIRRGLVEEVHADVKAEESPPRMVAFGRSLCKLHRYKPPRNNARQRWLTVDTVPKDIESMEVIWKGILHLRSTKEFCKYLRENPGLPQPEYLKKMGMLPGPGEKLRETGERSSIFFPQEMLAPKMEEKSPTESSTSSDTGIEPMYRPTVY